MSEPILRHDELPTISNERLMAYLDAIATVEGLIAWYPNRKGGYMGQREMQTIGDAVMALSLLRLPLTQEMLRRKVGWDE